MILLILPLVLCVEPVANIGPEARGRVGAAAEILEQKRVVLNLHATEHFPMQSVYKLPIGMVAVERLKLDQVVHVDKNEYVRPGQVSPLRDAHPNGADISIRDLLELSVSKSDGSASDVLLRLAGGPAVVMKRLSARGIKGIMVRDPEKTLGSDPTAQYRNWATPLGAISVLRVLQELHGPSRDLLMKFLLETATFPGRIKGLLPPGTVVAHKTGSSGEVNGIAAATNDIGIITLPDGRHLAVAVFVSDSKADDATRDRVIAKITRAAWDRAVGN